MTAFRGGEGTPDRGGRVTGRRDELRLLAEAGAQARCGAGQLILVMGPTGIGRTWLLSVARQHWSDSGLLVRLSQPTVADETTPCP
ncbi:hypothetical protein GCM10012275_22700 [Longimycelium tulufanense]|uniref:Uncharacterized protein n=1 Tax=Longimycelium tulufanense TaxID=907463 RepID=A0A8J3C7T5_9PSEU|nr:hypothetical protein [Longimycelium tulufanense]GGM51232.1 hypothetical protein GCM10012275_22700 [Longimycelium tulufanense]